MPFDNDNRIKVGFFSHKMNNYINSMSNTLISMLQLTSQRISTINNNHKTNNNISTK